MSRLVMMNTDGQEAMTITKEEIREDYQRFLRHEAMRANCSQEEIIGILKVPSEKIL